MNRTVTRELEGVQPAASQQHATRVLLVAPSAPPYGGMQLQADLLKKLLDAEQGFFVTALASNPAFPRYLRFLEIFRGVRPFARAVVFCFRFWRELEQIDVVHVMAASWLYFFLVVNPAVCLSRLRGKPVIVNYRGGEAGRFLSIWGRLARPAFRMADLVTAPSRFLKQILESHARVPVSVVPNVVNLSAFRYRQRTDLKPTILVTRHLEKIYDLESVLRAFRRIQERRPDACLWIAGTGSQEGYLRSLVSAWSLRNVRFLGQVSHEELPAVYDQCDIFLNASRVDNFPGALLEASASGLVVVTTNAGGIPYIYEQGKNALLVERGDYEGLALEVERVLEEPTLAFNLTTAALALVRQFEWKNVGESLRESYAFARTCRASSIRVQKSYI